MWILMDNFCVYILWENVSYRDTIAISQYGSMENVTVGVGWMEAALGNMTVTVKSVRYFHTHSHLLLHHTCVARVLCSGPRVICYVRGSWVHAALQLECWPLQMFKGENQDSAPHRYWRKIHIALYQSLTFAMNNAAKTMCSSLMMYCMFMYKSLFI